MANTEATEKLSHVRLPSEVAEETRANVEVELGVRVSVSTAVEWALKHHYLRLNMFASSTQDEPE